MIMLNYACCKYVVTRVTLYHSSLVDLSRSRSIHAVEHQPCCPDPLLFSSVDCNAVHYGLCSPLLKLPSFVVGHAAPGATGKIAPQPQRAQAASPVAKLDFDVLDPVELLAADLEGKLEALVNSFVAQDKVRLAARKSKGSPSPSPGSVSNKNAATGSSSSTPSTGRSSPADSAAYVTDKKTKDDAARTKQESVGNTTKKASVTGPAKEEEKIKSGKGADPVLKSAVEGPASSAGAKKDIHATRTGARAVESERSKSPKISALSKPEDTHGSKCKKTVGSPTNEQEQEVAEPSLPADVTSSPKSASPEKPTSTTSGHRTVFKVSPPNVISLVTGTPRTTQPASTTASSTAYVKSNTVPSSSTTTTTVSVKLRDADVESQKEQSMLVNAPKEKPSSQPLLNDNSQRELPNTRGRGVEAKSTGCNKHPTTSAVSYAKARFQAPQETTRLEEVLRDKPRSSHIVTDARSRWESLASTSGCLTPGQFWSNGYGSSPAYSNDQCLLVDTECDSPLSTSPRRLNSPDLYLDGMTPSIPHPKLTSSQKQHIRERSLSPTDRGHAHVPVRPFLTKGSVAERVLLFERCPDRSVERPVASTKPKSNLCNTSKHVVGDTQARLQNYNANTDSQTSSLKRVVRSSVKATSIPRFYYAQGKPLTAAQIESHLQKVSAAFATLKDGKAFRDNFGAITKACELPLYWKLPLFIASGAEAKGFATRDAFLDYWKRIISPGRDEPTWFVKIFGKGARNYLVPDDFVPLMQDVIDTHPGLLFLKDATEFHSRYVNTVIARIFYSVNRSWSGKITVPELRKSNFLQVLSLLEEEDDINQITEYFSYEHFYVIYCKFWELDKDHDLYIDRYDLSRHNEGAISMRMIDRIFSGAVSRGTIQKEGKMSYNEFVWFLMSEEDKRHPRSMEYWFRCMDLDGDGYLSMYELEYFYEEQLQRMESLGIETLPFGDCLCQMLDMIQPKQRDKVSLADLKRCRMTPIFFDTFFNLEKYLDHEQRDPFASQRDHDGDGMEISDWDRFAAEEYELLVAEEGNLESQDLLYSDYEPDDDELSPNLDKLTEPYHRRGRPASLDDDEYDYAETDTDYHY